MEKAIELENLRIRIDQLNEKLVSGIATRIKYPLNKGIFEEEFFERKSWFLYRLKKEQDLDSEFGRFLYNDQIPFVFKKEELTKAKIEMPQNKGVQPIEIDLSKKVISLYKETLNTLCEDREDKGTYGETTKLDVENVLTLNERAVGMGEQVAAFKISEDSEIVKLKDEKVILKKLIKPEREQEVVENILAFANKYGITNNEIMEKLAKEIIQIARETEVYFILNSKQKKK